MGTIQRSFEIALKKGECGERIFREFLEWRGWIVYQPLTKDKAHAFDMLATKDKSQIIGIDIKTKARLNKYAAQGINIKSWNEYLSFRDKMNIPFYLVFIDDKTGDVHSFEIGSEISSFNLTDKIIAWHLKDMDFLFNIGESNIKELSKFDQRNYLFNPNI